MADLNFDEQQARSGARQFDEVGRDLQALLQSVRSDLLDSPWSHDKIGSAFAGNFDGQRTEAVSNLDKYADAVDEIGPALTATADKIKKL